jgi:hypothetical protein
MPEKSTLPAQCASCAFNVIEPCIIAGVPRESLHCQKRIVTYPNATHCPYFERAAGAD